MEKVRIQDDLYTFVNQEKLDQLVIPDDRPAIGGFNTLAKDVEKTMINEFKEMCEKGEYPNDYLKNACTLFKVIQDVEKREKDGIAPALNNLKSSIANKCLVFIPFSFNILSSYLLKELANKTINNKNANIPQTYSNSYKGIAIATIDIAMQIKANIKNIFVKLRLL